MKNNRKEIVLMEIVEEDMWKILNVNKKKLEMRKG